MKAETIRRKLRGRRKLVEANFTRHLCKNSAMSSCITCNHYWGQLRSLDFALELFKKDPDLDSISNPDDQ